MYLETKQTGEISGTSVRPSYERCKICGSAAPIILRGHHGFSLALQFDVAACQGCGAHFAVDVRSAQPHESSRVESGVSCGSVAEHTQRVYDELYSQAEKISGYDRYGRYKKALLTAKAPLSWLAKHEDVYWAVAQALESDIQRAALSAKPIRVLEVGCGMGYLTYALRQAGLEVTGIDVSAKAVAAAQSSFGKTLYAHVSMEELVLKVRSKAIEPFDVVVSCEVIEHVKDPAGFVSTAAELLAPGGRLILTTPNKDIYGSHLAWHTDPAPVHLWWMGQRSLGWLAALVGMSAKFIDFGAFYGQGPAQAPVASKPATFDAQGRVIFRDGFVNTVARAVMRWWPASFKWMGRTFIRRQASLAAKEAARGQSLSLCVVMQKDA